MKTTDNKTETFRDSHVRALEKQVIQYALQREAAVAALRAVVKAVDINALKLGSGDNEYFNYAGKRVISEARAAIAAATSTSSGQAESEGQ